tara:strand:+ start:281 stop:574 length:294 start_codon:yes stop_codon:yes gene_type:complete
MIEEIEQKELSQKQRDQIIGYSSSITVDDSWIQEKDKLDLLKHIKTLYSEKYVWADDVLIKCLVKKHYNDVINNMNKEDYLKEKEAETTNDLIDRIV